MREILFWGATGQAKVLLEALQGTDIKLVALVDNREVPESVFGLPLLHGEKGLDKWLSGRDNLADLHFAIAVGGDRGRDRLMLMDLLRDRGLYALSIVHRTAFVAHNSWIGDGCQVLAQAAVCANARLGRGVIVNTGASVDHDCEIGDGVHLAPGVRLAGEVRVDARAFIGIGAIVLPRLQIGEDATVGAGAVITHDVPPGVTVVGNPARILVKA